MGTAAGQAEDPGGDTADRAALGAAVTNAIGLAIVQLRRLRSRGVRGAAASASRIRRRHQTRSR